MFREKEICNAIRTAYLYLFPDKKERKRALSRLNMELVAQSVRYRGESVLAYQTAGNHECSLNYYGPELFPQRGFCMGRSRFSAMQRSEMEICFMTTKNRYDRRNPI